MIDPRQAGPNPLDTQGLCLLSLDGGGVRGLSALFILRDVMSQLKRELGSSQPIRPCDFFDLIGGTSTGGLIAIMLGRLEMDIDDCIAAYSELMTTVFGEKLNKIPVGWSGDIRPQFDSTKLRSAIEHVITRAGFSPDAAMDDGTTRQCRAFVCSTAKDTLQVTRLRSYSVPNEDAIPATICEAALATSAATGYFDTAYIGKRAFVDGAFGANNPIEEVEEEAADIWCTKSRELKPLVKCFLSIGTGCPARVPMDDNMMKFVSKTLVRLATKPESTERRFMARWSAECKEKRIFRFNVEQGLQGVHMTAFEKRSLIESATQDYLRHSTQKSRVQDCIVNLASKLEKSSEDLDLIIQAHGSRILDEKALNVSAPGEPSIEKCWAVPLERNLRFVDREHVNKLKRIIFSNRNMRRIALVGLGGVGKTQIALELAYQTRQIYPECAVFWVVAVDMASIDNAYREIARQLGIEFDPQKMDVKVVVRKYLSQSYHGKWLMIFDNLDDLDICHDGKSSSLDKRMQEIIPSSEQGVVLFTTRSNRVAHHLGSTEAIQITEMDEHKATRMFNNLLVKKNHLSDQDVIRNLLARLTFLPLAIVQAASFINENDIDISSYLSLLDGQEQDVIDLLSEEFEDEGRYKSTRNPIAMTWLTSFMQIRKHNRLAADYLSFIACINPNEIPISILPRASSLEEQKAIGLLNSYSFTRASPDGLHLNMHRLVHLATRNLLLSTNSLRDWQIHVLQQVNLGFPRVDQISKHEWRSRFPHALRIIALTSEEPELGPRAGLLWSISNCCFFEGKYQLAEEYCLQATDLLKKIHGAEHEGTLYCLESLANIYLFLGESKKSSNLLRELLEIQRRINGPYSSQVLQVQRKLASSHRLRDELTEAEDLCKPLVRYAAKHYGPADSEFGGLINELILIYLRQGRFYDTLELAQLQLDICKKFRGSDEVLTLQATYTLGDLYMYHGRLTEAEALYEKAQECAVRLLGPKHPMFLRTMHQVAILYKSQGRRSEAIALMTECVRLRKEVLPHHDQTQDSCELLEQWTNPKTMADWVRARTTLFDRSDSMLVRREKYPRVKVCGGLYSARRQPRDSLFIREIRDSIDLGPTCSNTSTNTSRPVGSMDFEGNSKP